MDWNNIDWPALERLRTAFLDGTAGASDYWFSESDLASYDATFAQRIGWKWDYVLAELARRGWSAPEGELLDWGCGSGVAGRAFLDHFGTEGVTALRLWDRSSLAMQFAENRAREKYPGLAVTSGLSGFGLRGQAQRDPAFVLEASRAASAKAPSPLRSAGAVQDAAGTVQDFGATLLLSHVLTELTPGQAEALADLAAQATTVIWVEPGTHEASLTLIGIRERLRGRLNVVAPCTHQERCGILAPENERHWCHHFAPSPPEIFMDGHWARFARLAGVDLRRLPLSFLVLDQRPVPPLPAGATRVLGHPRVYKPHARLLGCDETGVHDRRLTKRAWPDEFRRLRKGECDPLQVWRSEGDEIVERRTL